MTGAAKLAAIMPTVWEADLLRSCGCQTRAFGDELLASPFSALGLDARFGDVCDRLASEIAAWGAHGVIGALDYPAALMAARIAQELRLPSPPLRSLLVLSHKYYSRQLQQSVVPEGVPEFGLLDAGNAWRGRFPIYVKPVKGTLSAWARRVDRADELDAALAMSPEQGAVFHALMEPMNQLLAGFPDLPISANHFIAEELLPGDLFTLEGWARGGQMGLLGVVDSVLYPGTRSFERFVYPSRLPASVQSRMWDWARRILGAARFDDGIFDVEYAYDSATDRLGIIEVNPRICPQFSDLYEKTGGINSYHLLASIATRGSAPTASTHRHPLAASCVLRSFSDGRLARIPSAPDLAEVERRFPGTRVIPLAANGEVLSSQLQDTESFRYAAINLGAGSAAELDAALAEVKALLRFQVEPA